MFSIICPLCTANATEEMMEMITVAGYAWTSVETGTATVRNQETKENDKEYSLDRIFSRYQFTATPN